MTDVYLSAGDLNLADALCFSDGLNYFIPGQQLSSGGVVIPAGINTTTHARGVVAPPATAPKGSRPVTIGLICTDRNSTTPSIQTVEANWRAVEAKLEQARKAAGAYGYGNRVCLWIRPAGASEFTIYDVLDGTFTYGFIGAPDGTPFKAGILQMFCPPYSRGQPIVDTVTGTIVNGSPQAVVFRPNVPGDYDALVQVRLTDQQVNGKVINRLRIGTRAVRVGGATATQFPAIQVAQPSGIGNFTNDANGINGFAVQAVAPQATPATLCTTSTVTPPYLSGLLDVIAKIRDGAAPPGTAGSFAATAVATGGSLPSSTPFAYLLTTVDAFNNESVPTPIQNVVTPPKPVAFYDDFNSGGVLLWDATVIIFTGGSAQSNYAEVAPAAAAAREGAFGLRSATAVTQNATASTAQAMLVKTFPGGGTSCHIRLSVRIASGVNTSTTGTITFPLIVDSSNATVVAIGTTNGTSWYLATRAAALTANPIPVAQPGDWFTLEIGVSVSAGNVLVDVYVNDALLYAAVNIGAVGSVGTPAKCAVGTTSNGAAAGSGVVNCTVDFDQVQIDTGGFIGAGAASVQLSWTNGANPTSYNLYYQSSTSRWRQIVLGFLQSYTHQTMTAGNLVDPPSTAPNILPSLFRAKSQLATTGAAVLQEFGQLIPAQNGAGNWELLNLGPLPCPPVVQPQGAAVPLPWQVQIDCMAGNLGTPTVACDLITFVPHSEDWLTAWVPGASLLAAQIWQLDTRYDDRVSGVLYSTGDGVTLTGQVETTGDMHLGPGDSWLVVLAETTDVNGHYIADVVNVRFALQLTIRPRYEFTRGAA